MFGKIGEIARLIIGLIYVLFLVIFADWKLEEWVEDWESEM